MNIHEKYIKRCIRLAKNASVHAYPNPAVGCVIVHNNTIIGEGYTSPYGGNHAEVNAINSVADKSLLPKSILYVSLEPCNHFGKTPPCSDLIVKNQISKVVVGCVDPFEKVAGTGIEKLKANGCEVIVGVLEKECMLSNSRFFTFHKKQRPYIVLKWAETKDGFIDKIRLEGDQIQQNLISNTYSRQLVHKWRAEEGAILIGTNTALHDNPKLNVRNWEGENPTRVILDRNLRIPKTFHVYDGLVKTIIVTEKKGLLSENLQFEKIDFSKNVAEQLCALLYKEKIQSVFIEGGKQTLQTFIDANLWDEARIFTGNVFFNDGLKAPTISGKEISQTDIKSDTLRVVNNSN